MRVESVAPEAAIPDPERVRARHHGPRAHEGRGRPERTDQAASEDRPHLPPGRMRRELAHHAQEVRHALKDLVKQSDLDSETRAVVRGLEKEFRGQLREAFRTARTAESDPVGALVAGVGDATDALAEALRSALGVAPEAVDEASAVPPSPEASPTTPEIPRLELQA